MRGGGSGLAAQEPDGAGRVGRGPAMEAVGEVEHARPVHQRRARAHGVADEEHAQPRGDRVPDRGGDAGFGPHAGHDEPLGHQAPREGAVREGAGVVLDEHGLVGPGGDLGADRGQAALRVGEVPSAMGAGGFEWAARDAGEVALEGRVQDRDARRAGGGEEPGGVREDPGITLHEDADVAPVLLLQIDEEEGGMGGVEVHDLSHGHLHHDAA